MKLETFFNKFDELADTPNGVKQLRELVMQLAVGGGLVPHSAAETAVPYASVEDATPINVSEVPENWRVVLLADAIKNRSGNSKLIKGKLHEEPAAGRFQGFSASGADVWCDDYEHEGQAIIISAVGARCGKAFKASGKWCAIANTNITRPEPTLFDFDFAYLVLNNEHFWVRGGSAQPFVKFPPSLDRHFAVPPLAEQKRIVAKVDELMALCDRLEVQQQERETRHAALARASLARFADAPTPANLHFLFHPSYAIPPADLRKSILTLAVQGKLVPQDPNDEPAEEVLARIAATKLRLQKSGEIGKEKPVEPLQPDSLPFEAPDSWRWAKLAELTELITKGSSPKWQGIAYVSEAEGILFITSENVGNYVLRKLDDLKYVSKGFNEIEPRSMLKRGDILMNLVGASIGRTAVYDLHDGANINQAVALIRLVRETDGVCPRFLLHYLNSPSAIDYMLSSRVVNAQPNISLTDAREFAVPIPPLAEQRRIVAKLEQLMALVDALETQLAASRATAANLLSALVAELTTGKEADAAAKV